MTRLFALALLAMWATTLQPGGSATAAAPLSADRLVDKVIEVRTTSGFRIRATLTRTTLGSDAKDVRQLSIMGRRSPAGSSVLYQQLWPAVPGGRALVIEQRPPHRLTGFLFESGTVTPLTDEMSGERFFGSDVQLEDVAETFWHWPSRQRAGEEFIGEDHTVIVDLRPGPGTPSTYSLVKAWISPDRAVALRAQMFGRDGRLLTQVGSYRVLRVGDRWIPAILTVEPANKQSRTVIEGVRIESVPPMPASAFTVGAVRKLVGQPARSSQNFQLHQTPPRHITAP